MFDTFDKFRGRFIVLDGLHGSGMSSHHRRLESELVATGRSVLSCRDPGGTVYQRILEGLSRVAI